MQLPAISDENYVKCEIDITEDNLFVALKSMPYNKSSGKDELSKELYEIF